MASAPLLGTDGGAAGEVELGDDVFGAEARPHLLHEAVRAELNAHRAGTRGAKSRGMVAGGAAKPWRQKGTGRARAGTIRAPQFTGGGVVFPPGPRNFEVKVNRKARKAALSSALSLHAREGTLAFVDASGWDTPSTKSALGLLGAWEKERPLVVVADEADDALVKSFRNLERVVVTVPAELEVAHVMWARSLLVSQAALPLVQVRAGG